MTTQLQYSSFDFTTVKDDLINMLRSDPVFRDYNFTGSNINMVIELISATADLFNYYINAMTNESFLHSAELYENLNKLAELVGYNPTGIQSSTVTVTLSADVTVNNSDDYFTIPKWTSLTATSTTDDGQAIKYLTTSSLTFTGTVTGANEFSDEILLVQGEMVEETFSGTGLAYQFLELAEDNATEEYMEIIIDDVIWTHADNLYRNTDNTSKVYTTRYNKNKKIEISFGDGTYGVVPPTGINNIAVRYVKSLGEQGAIGANELTQVDDEIKLIDGISGFPVGDPIVFTVIQTDVSEGHKEALTEEEVRNYTPRWYRMQDRVVTSQDHEDILLTKFNQYVLTAVTINSDDYFRINPSALTEATSGRFYNNVYMYIVPRYSDNVTGTLRQQILDYLEDYKMATINYVIKDVDYRQFDVQITFKKLSDTVRTASEISNDVDTAIRGFFTRANRSLGEEIKYSSILSDLQAISGISSITLALSADTDTGWKYENVPLELIQFPKLKGLSITYSGTGV